MAVLAALGVRYANTAKPEHVKESNRPAQIYVRPASVPLTGTRKVAARRVAQAFLVDAVLRKDPGAAWDISAPALREGMSRSQWEAGNLPVVPYAPEALRIAKWRLSYSYARRVGYEVGLFPKPGASELPTRFTLELVEIAAGPTHRWAVGFWAPAPTLDPPPPSARPGASSQLAAAASERSSLSAYWLVFPLALLGLIVAVPVGIVVHERRRSRRAEAAYQASRYNETSSPS